MLKFKKVLSKLKKRMTQSENNTIVEESINNQPVSNQDNQVTTQPLTRVMQGDKNEALVLSIASSNPNSTLHSCELASKTDVLQITPIANKQVEEAERSLSIDGNVTHAIERKRPPYETDLPILASGETAIGICEKTEYQSSLGLEERNIDLQAPESVGKSEESGYILIPINSDQDRIPGPQTSILQACMAEVSTPHSPAEIMNSDNKSGLDLSVCLPMARESEVLASSPSIPALAKICPVLFEGPFEAASPALSIGMESIDGSNDLAACSDLKHADGSALSQPLHIGMGSIGSSDDLAACSDSNHADGSANPQSFSIEMESIGSSDDLAACSDLKHADGSAISQSLSIGMESIDSSNDLAACSDLKNADGSALLQPLHIGMESIGSSDDLAACSDLKHADRSAISQSLSIGMESIGSSDDLAACSDLKHADGSAISQSLSIGIESIGSSDDLAACSDLKNADGSAISESVSSSRLNGDIEVDLATIASTLPNTADPFVEEDTMKSFFPRTRNFTTSFGLPFDKDKESFQATSESATSDDHTHDQQPPSLELMELRSRLNRGMLDADSPESRCEAKSDEALNEYVRAAENEVLLGMIQRVPFQIGDLQLMEFDSMPTNLPVNDISAIGAPIVKDATEEPSDNVVSAANDKTNQVEPIAVGDTSNQIASTSDDNNVTNQSQLLVSELDISPNPTLFLSLVNFLSGVLSDILFVLSVLNVLFTLYAMSSGLNALVPTSSAPTIPSACLGLSVALLAAIVATFDVAELNEWNPAEMPWIWSMLLQFLLVERYFVVYKVLLAALCTRMDDADGWHLGVTILCLTAAPIIFPKFAI